MVALEKYKNYLNDTSLVAIISLFNVNSEVLLHRAPDLKSLCLSDGRTN